MRLFTCLEAVLIDLAPYLYAFLAILELNLLIAALALINSKESLKPIFMLLMRELNVKVANDDIITEQISCIEYCQSFCIPITIISLANANPASKTAPIKEFIVIVASAPETAPNNPSMAAIPQSTCPLFIIACETAELVNETVKPTMAPASKNDIIM